MYINMVYSSSRNEVDESYRIMGDDEMISLYSGTPGSGKSLHVNKIIENKLIKGGNVICNFPICIDKLRRKPKGKFVFLPNNELTVSYLTQFAKDNHKKRQEGQTLIVIDEAQLKFNPREYNNKDRMEFINFFTIHRHLFFNVILISQMDRMIDRQIRGLIEYEVKHRKLNNFGFIGKLIPFPYFVAITMWYGAKARADVEYFTYNKRLGNLYDSYALFK